MKIASLIEVLAIVLGALCAGLIFWSGGSTDPMWAIISFVLVYDPDARSLLSTALSRLTFTILGSLLAIGLVFTLGLQKWTLPVGLGIAALLCALAAPSRAARRVLLVTVALIIGSAILQPDLGPYIAVTRSIEVSVGSALAVVFSWATHKVTRRFESREPA